MAAFVNIRNLHSQRGSFHLHADSLSIERGEIASVMGPSGCGKSTLLQSLAGLISLQSGEIEVAGKRIENLPPEKRRTAMVFQQPALFPHLTVEENIAYGISLQGLSKEVVQEKVATWIKKLELQGLEKRFPKELSGGQEQRAEFARALVTGFELLLLDEPFSALDSGTRQQARHSLKMCVKETGVAALLVTHDPEDAKELSTQIYFLENGKIR